MKRYWNIIRITILLFVVVGLYLFTNRRNDQRPLIAETVVEFTDEAPLFVSEEMVNKLLIQSNEEVTDMTKEKLALNKLEQTVNADEMIRNANVYVTVDGQLKVKIQQKTPIARVNGDTSFYIDTEGGIMPLSNIMTARVPLITGMHDKEVSTEIYDLAMEIHEDEFLRKNVIGIHQEGNKFSIYFRIEDFVINLGDLHNLSAKFNNLKAFYQKASKDNTLKNYHIVNLEFNNQIVCTKK